MKKWAGLCALLGACLLVGCGGGGVSSLSGATGGSRVAVLLTDSFREDYAHVWATIYRMELTSQSGSKVVLFDDSEGHQIDLKTLRDASGERFSFLGSATVPAGTYTGISVTVGPTMQLFRNGVAVGDPLPVDDSLPKDTSGNPILSLTFGTPKTVSSGTTNIVVDFDLARFIVRNSKVIPAIKEGTTNGLANFGRHNQGGYRGTVSSLTGTAPDLTFTLTRKDGTTVSVTTSASTALYGTGTLADGVTVEVRGTLDTTTQALVATHLQVAGTGGPRKPRVSGAASDLNATAGTFTVTVSGACVFTPSQTTVNIVTSETTAFRGDDGSTLTKADFFTALAATPNVLASGTYDSAANTLTADVVKIVDATQDGGWERGGNRFRKGTNQSNWGRGHFRR